MNWKKIIIAGVTAGFVILIVTNIVNFIVQFIWPYNVLELGGMRSVDEPIMLAFFLHYWVISFTMAILYSFVGQSFKGNFIQKGRTFSLLVWLVASIPSAFVVYTSMNYPIGFTVSQVVGSLLYMLGAGITIAKLME